MDKEKSSKGQEGWSSAKKDSYQKRVSNPNQFYYRHNDPGEKKATGSWTSLEHELFMRKFKENYGEALAGQSPKWGIFSQSIPGRVGYQCSNYYRLLVKNGTLKDGNYTKDDSGKIHFVFKGATSKKPNNNNNNNNSKTKSKPKGLKSKRHKIERDSDEDSEPSEHESDQEEQSEEDAAQQSENESQNSFENKKQITIQDLFDTDDTEPHSSSTNLASSSSTSSTSTSASSSKKRKRSNSQVSSSTSSTSSPSSSKKRKRKSSTSDSHSLSTTSTTSSSSLPNSPSLPPSSPCSNLLHLTINISSHLKSSNTDLNLLQNFIHLPLCSLCGTTSTSNDHSTLSQLIACVECGTYSHSFCIASELVVNETWNFNKWRCTDCKTCDICHDPGNESLLLSCDSCDQGFHIFCLNPPLETIPTHSWFCQSCNDFKHNKSYNTNANSKYVKTLTEKNETLKEEIENNPIEICEACNNTTPTTTNPTNTKKKIKYCICEKNKKIKIIKSNNNKLKTVDADYKNCFILNNEEKDKEQFNPSETGIKRVGNLILVSTGRILYHLSPFHNFNHLFPVGFKSLFHFWSLKNVRRQCWYYFEIQYNSTLHIPVFKLSCEDEQSLGRNSFQSIQEAWSFVLNSINLLRKHPNEVKEEVKEEGKEGKQEEGKGVEEEMEKVRGVRTGEEMVGIGLKWIKNILESLENVSKCKQYYLNNPYPNQNPNPSSLSNLYPNNNPSSLSILSKPVNNNNEQELITTNADSVVQNETNYTCARTVPLSKSAPKLTEYLYGLPRAQFLSQMQSLKDQEKKENYSSASLSLIQNKPAALEYSKLLSKTTHFRIYRSKVHGFGMFSLKPIQAGEMVIEYIGEIIRQLVADVREAMYKRRGLACYMFRLDEERIIDATMKGNMARMINHSCDPNTEAKTIVVEGKKRIVLYATKRVEWMEEITYNYHFSEEEGKLQCMCGSENCTGWMN